MNEPSSPILSASRRAIIHAATGTGVASALGLLGIAAPGVWAKGKGQEEQR